MADTVYNLAYLLGWPVFYATARRVILHRDRVPRAGAFILAPNHLSPYDIPCLMDVAPRVLDFVSITELFQNRWVAGFFSAMGSFPLNRRHPNAGAIRTVLERLSAGRAVVMFPEGRICRPEESVLHGGAIRPGVVHLAQRAGVGIVPCVLVGTSAYKHPGAWLPLRRTLYAANFGEMIMPGDDPAAMERRLQGCYGALYRELREALSPQENRRICL
jgi:1-acyl-sn-glycerol-3-phosphate acyltransferase